ncbi:ABC transporter ATP-binding protein [Paracoccus albus]|uniref:ABC transporter ATP-binding protein n=1 Tax=Paracoccus albus TaxID=3017784 RepID=UPI0022EFDF50|nr:ABC transporter ATP-binding protein [Paracoccus albus]WBU62109.1 ABC transporter ATP-binding protein [Paracoccus albus]
MPPLLAHGRRWLLARVAVLTLLQGTAAGAAAIATRGLFAAMNARQSDLPMTELLVLALSGTVIASVRVAAQLDGEKLGQAYALDLRKALFEHACAMSASDVAARRSGYVGLRFVGDMTAFRNWARLGLPRLVAGCILIPVTFLVLAWLSPVLLWAILPPTIVALAAIVAGGASLVPLQRRLRARRGRIAADMTERMALAPELDRLGQRGRALRSLQRRSERMIDAALARLRMAEMLKSLPDLIAGITAALVILIGARAGLGTDTIAAALAALGLLLTPMRELAGVWNHYAAWRAARDKCAAALSRPRRGAYGRLGLPPGPIALRIDELRLDADSDPLTLIVDPGACHLLKLPELQASRLFSFLQRLEAPYAGAIFLSGIPIEDLSRGTLRRNICRIGPDRPMLRGSLRRVLTVSASSRPDDDGILEVIDRLGLRRTLCPDGDLDRRVSEGGSNLSAEQRAAVSLVQAAIAKPRLVLIGQDLAAAGPDICTAVSRWLRAMPASVLCVENVASRLEIKEHAEEGDAAA